MTLKVIGPGVGRTGTLSLKLALERLLGGRCHHMAEILADRARQLDLWAPVIRGDAAVDWELVFDGYVAQTDFPGAAKWQELTQTYPDALVILSTRPAESWYRSATATVFQLDPEHESSPFQPLWNEWLGNRFDDRDAMIEAYERHYASIRAAIPPDRLLEWNVADGWEPLCTRLEVPVPDEPFPLTNTTAEFRAANSLNFVAPD